MPMRLPICVDCQIDMLPLKNSFIVEVMAGARPHMKVAADKYGCPNCGIEIVVGFAPKPLTTELDENYTHGAPADLQVWCSLEDKARANA